MSTATLTGAVATAACRLCPPRGGVVVAAYSGDGPACAVTLSGPL